MLFFLAEMPETRECLCAIYEQLCMQVDVLCNNSVVLSLSLQVV